jgi:hypothetical protein
MSVWIGLISGLAGVIVGGILNHFTTRANFHRQTQWEREKILQQKLEEIAQVAEQIAFHFQKLKGDAMLAIESGTCLSFGSEAVPLAKLRMLVCFYAPELAKHIQMIEDAREKFGQPLVKALEGRVREKPERQQINGDLIRGEYQLSKACDSLAEAAADLGKKYFKIS